MFKQRSYQQELMDDLDLASDALEKNLRELEIINTRLGGYKVTLNALNSHIDSLPKNFQIMDIGSGAGDMLRKMAEWGRLKKRNIRLIGIDANAFMINYSKEKCKAFDEIVLQQANVFDMTPSDYNSEVITMNLFCHHFTNEQLRTIFKTISESNCKLLVINDLHRHPLAYYSIKFLTRLFNGSYLVKNDAPLSVLRGFKQNEMKHLFVETNFDSVELKWQWAFRWQLCAFKNE